MSLVQLQLIAENLRDNLASLRDMAASRFGSLDERVQALDHKVERMDQENRASHVETNRRLESLHVLVGEHGAVLRHHQTDIDALKKRDEQHEADIDNLVDKTGEHDVVVAVASAKEMVVKQVTRDLTKDRTEKSRFWLTTIIAVVGIVLGLVAGYLGHG